MPGGGGEGRNLRYNLELPASVAHVDETLTACGRPLDDPRDAELEALPPEGLPADLGWAERPRPNYPEGSRYARGFAVLTCLTTTEGALRECVVESEHPSDGGFGDEAIDATRRARVVNTLNREGPIPVRRILYRVNFMMDGHLTREDTRRRREQRDRDRAAREAERAAD